MNNKNYIHNKIRKLPFTEVKIDDSFWMPRLAAHKDTVIEACLRRCEETGRIDNFSKAAGQMEGTYQGQYYNDSDVYKVLEGIAYSLQIYPDKRLEQTADLIIEKISVAQWPDGYLNTYFTMVAPDERWKDMEKHEDYCAGHMIEAAVAYYNATGKRKFLHVACRMADHMLDTFGDNKHWVVGHQGVELALIILYNLTRDSKYAKLAKWFIEERGHGYGKGAIWNKKEWGKTYCQDDKPIRELNRVSGHAVRAMYYYAGIADVAMVLADKSYLDVLDKLWNNLTLKNMYLTGGIGSSKENEGFTKDYDLSNANAYCETCASIGLIFFSYRMFLIKGGSRYIDVLEKALYNCALAGMSADGNRFFYGNPMLSDGTKHRQEWYDCSCCPTQIARLLPSIGDYIYAVSDNIIWVNLFISGECRIKVNNSYVNLIQNTRYPWDGKTELVVKITTPHVFSFNIRFPGWCGSVMIFVNSEVVENVDIQNGYIILARNWEQDDKITCIFDMPVEKVYSHPKVIENIGKVAIQRGPVVYCVEETDNADFDSIAISSDTEFTLTDWNNIPGKIIVISAINHKTGLKFIAVPYFFWDNRKAGKMLVWINEKH